MELLIKALDELYASDGEFNTSNEKYDLVCDLCWNLFTRDGAPYFKNIRKFNEDQKTYHVGPGEVDSFGWLTGVVTKRGDIREVVWG